MAKQMKNMSDTQVKVMMKAANVVQGGVKAVKKTKDFFMSKNALLIALLIVILAIILRYLGVM